MPQRGMQFDWHRLKRWLPRRSAPSKPDAAENIGRYVLAIGCTLLALYCRLLLDPWLGHDYPFVAFLLALLAVLWWCGTGPALLVLGLSIPLALWFLVPPRGTMVLRESGHWLGMAGYTVVGAAVIWFGWLLRQSQQQLKRQVDQIAKNRESLTREIQERKQVEEALRQSEEEFRTAFEISAVGQAQAEPVEGRLLRVNSTFCRITGYASEELLGKPHLELVDSANRQACGQLFEHLVRGEIPIIEIEERYRRKDGRLIEVAIMAALVRCPAGRPLRVTAIVQDITPRKQAQEALRQSEQRFRAVVDSNMVGIAFANLQTGRVLDANDAYLELIGRSREALRSGQLNFKEYTSPESAPLCEVTRQALLSTRKSVKPFEKVYVRPDGSRVDILMGTAPLDPACEQAIAYVLDISDRKRLERELRDREEEFRTSFELSAVGQAQADPILGRFLRVNAGFCELTGYSEEQLLGMSYLDLVHPAEREQSRTNFQSLVQGRIKHLCKERSYVRRNGTVIQAEIAAAVVRDASGRPLRVVGVFQDITPRKEAEAALRRGQEQLRLITDVIPSLISYVDRDFCYQFNNFAYEEWLGRPRSEVTGHRMPEVLSEAVFRQIQPYLQQVIETGQAVQFDDRMPYRTGSRWVNCIYMPHRDEAGQILGVVILVNDITARKQSEQALHEAKEKLQRVLDSITEAYFALDGAGHFLEINRAAEEKVFHRPAAQLIGKSFAVEYPEGAQCECFRRYTQALVEQRPAHFETRSEISGRWYEYHVYPYADRLEVYLHDVTQRKQNEMALQAAKDQLSQYAEELARRVQERTAELQQSVRSMQEFTYTIAHDLRAPLRATHSFATLLLENYGAQLGEEGRQFAQRLTEAATHMDQLIHDLLDYGRVASVEAPLGEVRTERLVQGIIQDLQSSSAGRQARFHVRQPLPLVCANATLLSKALWNLMHNALKFVAPGVTPQIEIYAEELSEGWVRVSVQDNGVGIAPEFHQQIFRTFQRLCPEYAGTGMGLAIVQKAVERMRGRLGVNSQPGQGSCFWIELPKA